MIFQILCYFIILNLPVATPVSIVPITFPFEPEENFGTLVMRVYGSDHLYCPHQRNLSGHFLLLVVALKIP